MNLTSLIAEYGYWAVFVGCFLEGETVLLLAGFAAHRGMLQFEQVAVVAFVASTLGDQMFFWLGRRHGDKLLRRFPRLGLQIPRVQTLLDRHHVALILSIRFLYGLRVAGPIAIGALRVSPLRFAWLNLIGAAIWAVLITTLGYQFGNALQWVFDDMHRIEETVLVLILLAGFGHFAWKYWRSRKRSR
jgi:membrane protein DedA with SNARE-associated domain